MANFDVATSQPPQAQPARIRRIADTPSDSDSGVPSQRQRTGSPVHGYSLATSGNCTPSRTPLSDVTNLQSVSGAAPRSRESSQASLNQSVHPSQLSTAHGSQAGSQAALPFDRPAEVTEYVVASRLARIMPTLTGANDLGESKKSVAESVLAKIYDIKDAAAWWQLHAPAGMPLPAALIGERIGSLDVKYELLPPIDQQRR
tara:strand:+ start:1207 stop:1812 length:606 start_codon:yes stop_codon:yes gene_type:complete